MQWWQHNSSLPHLLRSVFWHLCSPNREPLQQTGIWSHPAGVGLCAPYPVYHLQQFSCPATSPREHWAKHSFCTQVTGQSSSTEAQRKAPAWQGCPLPVCAAFINTQNDGLKTVVKNIWLKFLPRIAFWRFSSGSSRCTNSSWYRNSTWPSIEDFTSLSFKHLNQLTKVWAAASRTSHEASSRRFKTSEKEQWPKCSVNRGVDFSIWKKTNVFCQHSNYCCIFEVILSFECNKCT